MNKQKNSVMKEEEIRPDYLKVDQAAVVASDIKRLLSHKHKFILVACPACGSHSSTQIFKKQGLQYTICNDCETVYINPRPTPEILEMYYRTSKHYEYWNKYIFPASEAARRKKIFRPRVRKVIEFCKHYGLQPKTLLEVGAGFGTFCEEVIKTKFFSRVIAIEPTPDLAETCRKRGIEVIEKPVEEVKLKNIRPDVVASFEVIEHLFRPQDFIKSCAALLPKGGIIVLTCPNVKGFDMEVLGKFSGSFDNEHLNYFHPKSLAVLLKKLGFEVIDISTPGKLDVELVRKAALEGKINVSKQPFLRHILIEQWEESGQAFQQFLSDNMLSSHMWIAGRKI